MNLGKLLHTLGNVLGTAEKLAPQAQVVTEALDMVGVSIPHEIADAAALATLVLSDANDLQPGQFVSIPAMTFHHDGVKVTLSGNADGSLTLTAFAEG